MSSARPADYSFVSVQLLADGYTFYFGATSSMEYLGARQKKKYEGTDSSSSLAKFISFELK